MKELKRNPRSYKIADKHYKNAIRRAKKDGRKVSRIAEEVIMAYADGAWTITFDITPKELLHEDVNNFVPKSKLKSSNKK